MQRTYPQIYKSDSKLKVDPTLVKVTAKDFMVSIKSGFLDTKAIFRC